jgi:hypothetical protein
MIWLLRYSITESRNNKIIHCSTWLHTLAKAPECAPNTIDVCSTLAWKKQKKKSIYKNLKSVKKYIENNT